MTVEIYGIITFESTHHAIRGENIIKKLINNIRTIPTPREITTSCGLSIKFDISDKNAIIETIKKSNLAIKGIYKITKKGHEKKIDIIYSNNGGD
ncbi:DUF3343 domain-containing protein [Clostridiisalibacter paucivorans]|uniref:DUF3343 domain-containing protein n=1 Tax=Clostridiisalibacter paucivorans TaxID=408753 RepID=UPI00047920ED|nr:DUF3343 domain-containing protein [Clostridiisalibacter paucivorans]